MKIDSAMYIFLFLGCTLGLFYLLTVLIQKICIKIRDKRRCRYINSDDSSHNSINNTNNCCGVKSGKAILKAKESMRSKKNGK